MKLELGEKAIRVTLSRKNLSVLLDKLNGTPSLSAKTLYKYIGSHMLIVTAEEDEDHYKETPAGLMHPSNEALIASRKWQNGKGRD